MNGAVYTLGNRFKVISIICIEDLLYSDLTKKDY